MEKPGQLSEEEYELERRRPVVEMLKTAFPELINIGNEILQTPDLAKAIQLLQEFNVKTASLPADSDFLPGNNEIIFTNYDNGRQFKVMYQITENTIPAGQKFSKTAQQASGKTITIQVGYSASHFEK